MPIRVLLADDHSVVLDGLRGYLQSQRDVTVVGAVTNGREAVAAARKLAPDVVLMDISMPELDGIDTTREIRKACPATQVVIFSMYSTRDHISAALRSGARGYVSRIQKAKRSATPYARRMWPALPEPEDRGLRGRRISGRRAGECQPASASQPPRTAGAQADCGGRIQPGDRRSLGISRKSVVTYRSRMLQKLDIHSVAELVKFAIQNGLTDL